VNAHEEAEEAARLEARKRAVKRHSAKRSVKLVINGLWIGAIVAFQLMFALALFGHPQFGFLELWLAADAVATLISSGVAGGLSTFSHADIQASD
jgi:fluoride ion exporter CrcB/FEX